MHHFYIWQKNTKEIGDIFWAHKESMIKYDHKINTKDKLINTH